MAAAVIPVVESLGLPDSIRYRDFLFLHPSTTVKQVLPKISNIRALIERLSLPFKGSDGMGIDCLPVGIQETEYSRPFSVSRNFSMEISSCLMNPWAGRSPLLTISMTAHKEAAVVQEMARQ